jgi:lipoprotein-anchoring transpeptidase ErfK/SrfK
MPDRRPPDELNLLPPVRLQPPGKGKPPRRPRSRRQRKRGESRLPFWIAGGLLLVIIVLILVYAETPRIRSWFFGEASENPSSTPDLSEPVPRTIAPPLPPVVKLPPAPAAAEADQQKTLQEKADEQTRLLIEQSKKAATLPPPPTAPVASTSAPTPAPLAPPASSKNAPPARALPLDMEKLDTERIAAYQVALERMHFSCGFIDGDQGMRTQRMLRAFQTSRNLPITGFLDPATRAAIGEPGEPFLTYTVTAEDIASIMPKPDSWRAKSKATRLGYNNIWELLAEKFHCTRAYLKALNPDVSEPVAGTDIIGPKVYPAEPIPKAASLRISLADTSIEALDADGRIIAFFPCSIAKDKNKRPHGRLEVKVVDPNPDYTFDPALFADASKAEGITHKLTLPPGPRNPVGTTWVGLNLPGYGIHGTPDPESISRTQSHGCFRLANWNAEKVIKMVRVGTPVDVEP